jgi:hypothetical protein
MAKSINNQVLEIPAGGGTFTLPNTDGIIQYYIKSGVTLTSNVSFQSSGTLAIGDEYNFYYEGNTNLNGNVFTFFGQQVPQEILNRNCYMRAIFNGSDFKVIVTPDISQNGEWVDGADIVDETISTSKIEDSAITTVKINNESVTVSKLGNLEKHEVLTCELSFESNEQGAYRIYLPYKCEIVQCIGRVTKALSGTDEGTVVFATSTGNTGAGTLTFASSSAFGTEQIASFTFPNNIASAGSYIQATTEKTTAGGKILASIIVKRVV